MWKKAGVALVAGILLIGAALPPKEGATDPAFLKASIQLKDIAGHWAQTAIEQAIAKGYVDGYEDGTFRPEQSVTRAEFVKMVATALRLPVSGSVEGSDWYVPYSNAAVNEGIHRWSDFTAGDWNTFISREDMARWSVRATDEELRKAEANQNVRELMYLATKSGLIQGLNNGELGVDQPTTRAQSVTVIERILTVHAGGTLEVDKYAVNRAELAWHKTNIFTVMPQFFGNVHHLSKWDPDQLFIQTEDGKYRGELDNLIAIDLDDPNDPHRGMLGDVSELSWYHMSVGKYTPLINTSNAYILYFTGKTVFNFDTEQYMKGDDLWFSISGFKYTDDEMRTGELVAPVRLTRVVLDDVPALIIPKTAKTRGNLYIKLSSPAYSRSNDDSKTLLRAVTPDVIE